MQYILQLRDFVKTNALKPGCHRKQIIHTLQILGVVCLQEGEGNLQGIKSYRTSIQSHLSS